MKLNLLYANVDDVLSGYTNIAPFATQEEDGLFISDIKNLNKFCDDTEATEIIATDVIDYLLLNEVNFLGADGLGTGKMQEYGFQM